MYVFSTPQNDIYQQGVDEGRRQVLADLAKIVKDASDLHGDVDGQREAIGEEVYNYLEQEGYL